jgi:dihydroxyacetone synthase
MQVNGLNGDSHSIAALSDDDLAVREIRKLVIDICRQNGGGHGGSAIDMAPLGVALWRHTMRYNPRNPDWFDRDRVVLSNGHAAMFLYSMLHVSGYTHMTVDELRMYADPKAVDPQTGKWRSTLCHGHPEIQVPGVEVTTGPLGQGVANAVGLAIASKHYAALFNREGHQIVNSRIYCICGDGCLQEGVAQEALAIAGRLGLDNLVLCYDNNQVTCDGPLEWIVTEDTNEKMRAIGWNVLDVMEGDTSVESIVAALKLARETRRKPTMINIRTTIGYGTATAGTYKSHHGTYTDEDAALYADTTNELDKTHTLSDRTNQYLRHWSVDQGAQLENDWSERLRRYKDAYPEQHARLEARMAGSPQDVDYSSLLNRSEMPAPSKIQATRTFNGTVFNSLMSHIPNLMAGGADLWNSNQLGDQSHHIFDRDNASGRVIRYGIREHAMASISNGLAAYSPQGIIPVTATFFMFYLYAAAGVRMGALSELQVIHVATHDSVGEGQNGPTHQPVELDSLYRAMPNLLYIRPCDAEEVAGAWTVALGATRTPSIISLARDPALTKVPNTDRDKVRLGGYVIREKQGVLVTLISCGSELQFASAAADELDKLGIPTRVVSMPCLRLFERQPLEYQNAVLSNSPHIISVEAYISTIWARICTASIAMDSYGYSGAGLENFKRFGLDTDSIVRKVSQHVKKVESGEVKARRWILLE